MSREIFVDTSAWYPAVARGHADHGPVAAALRAAVADGWRVVTTNLVVAETYVLLLRRLHRTVALEFVRTVGAAPNLVIWSTEALERRAIAQWLERLADQPFSLTDAVSFAVMAERSILTALALDRHFVVAGFEVAPASPR